jgi:ribosomal protein S2
MLYLFENWKFLRAPGCPGFLRSTFLASRVRNPRDFKPYILIEKNGVHIINLEETIKSINEAKKYVKNIVRKNGEILFVGTKKQAQTQKKIKS